VISPWEPWVRYVQLQATSPTYRVLKHLFAMESPQAHSEDVYYGHLLLRLMASFALFYTSRVMCKGQRTMEEIIFSLKYYWRWVDLEALQLHALS
jgi:hypothetical protein